MPCNGIEEEFAWEPELRERGACWACQAENVGLAGHWPEPGYDLDQGSWDTRAWAVRAGKRAACLARRVRVHPDADEQRQGGSPCWHCCCYKAEDAGG